jgi:hypothetical protein
MNPDLLLILDILKEFDSSAELARMDKTYTVADMIQEIEQGTETGLVWAADVLRVSRGILARQALRGADNGR